MFKNRFIRSLFAVALALSLLLPSIPLQADTKKEITLRGSSYGFTKIARFTLTNFDEVNSVTGVKVNDKSYRKVDNQDSLQEDETYFLNDTDPQVMLRNLKNGDKVELFTKDGFLHIDINNIDAYFGGIHNKRTLKFTFYEDSSNGGDAGNPGEGGSPGDSGNPGDNGGSGDNGTPEQPGGNQLIIHLKPIRQFSNFHIESDVNLNGKISSLSVNHVAYELVTSSYMAWYPQKYYIDGRKIHLSELEHEDVLSLVDLDGNTHSFVYKKVGSNVSLEAIAEAPKPKRLQVRIRGSFEAAMENQKGYDAISGATSGGAIDNQNSNVKVEVFEGDNPEESDWKPLHESKVKQKKLTLILDAESGMEPVYNNLTSALTLRGTPKKAGKYKVKVILEEVGGRTAESNELPFHVYDYNELLIDHFKVENAKKMQDGKYIWDMEPWVIQKFGGEQESVLAPKEIKAWFGSHKSGTYGELGTSVHGEPTQTLIIGEGTNLTLVNMKILSSVKILVKDGGVLNLMDSSLHGKVEVRDGGILQVNYDAHKGKFLTGSSINGQVELKDGAILENSLLYSNTNYLANGELVRQNVNPVVKISGKVRINGKVFVKGDEAPGGIDPNTGKSYKGQPALGLEENAELELLKDAVLGLYGGGKTHLSTQGGAALLLAGGSTVSGEGSLIAIPGNTVYGDGSVAVEGSGTLAAKQLYIQGGNTHDKKAKGGKPLGETVKVDMRVEPVGKLLEGKAGAGQVIDDQPRYWQLILTPPDYEYLKEQENQQPITWKPTEENGGNAGDNGGSVGDNGGSAGNNGGNAGNNGGNANSGNAGNPPSQDTGNANNSGNHSIISDSGSTGGSGSFVPSRPAPKKDGNSDVTIQDAATPLSASEKALKEELEGLTIAEHDRKLIERLLLKEIGNAAFAREISEDALREYAKTVNKVFADESEASWYAKELSAMRLMKLMQGYEDGTMRAENPITGKEYVTILVRAGAWEIEKVDGDWFAPYLKVASEKKLLDQIEFDLSKQLSREEIAALSYNFAKIHPAFQDVAEKSATLTDGDLIDNRYKEAVKHLFNREVLKGNPDGAFAPKQAVKRAEVLAIVYRLLATSK
ncbi:MAG: S-layer homology domain-containing protein [Bacillota bacterium]|nr:S-layer homology domain-containing protein [Bacillota bacterium]